MFELIDCDLSRIHENELRNRMKAQYQITVLGPSKSKFAALLKRSGKRWGKAAAEFFGRLFHPQVWWRESTTS